METIDWQTFEGIVRNKVLAVLCQHAVVDANGYSVLHRACWSNPSIVHHLDDHQRQNEYGDTALHYANTYPYLIPLLKWHEIRNTESRTALQAGWLCSHTHVLAKLRRLLGTLPAAYIRLVHSYT